MKFITFFQNKEHDPFVLFYTDEANPHAIRFFVYELGAIWDGHRKGYKFPFDRAKLTAFDLLADLFFPEKTFETVIETIMTVSRENFNVTARELGMTLDVIRATANEIYDRYHGPNEVGDDIISFNQAEMAAFAHITDRMINGDDMGIGKTRTMVAAADYRTAERILIVAPGSVLYRWQAEIVRVLGESEANRVCVVSDFSKVNYKARWIIISYGLLISFTRAERNQIKKEMDESGAKKKSPSMFNKATELLNKFSPDYVLVDEAHRLQNGQSDTSKAVKILLGRAFAFITGTALRKRPINIYNPLKLIGHYIARSKIQFAETFCEGKMNYLGYYDYSGTNLEKMADLHNAIKNVFARRTKEQILDLPKKIVDIHRIDLTDAELKSYSNAMGDYLAKEEQKMISKGMSMDAIVNRLSNIDSSDLVFRMKSAQRLSMIKAKALIERIDEHIDNGQKVCVYTSFSDTLEFLVNHYKGAAVPYDGSKYTPTPAKKWEAEKLFKSDPTKMVFVANAQAGKEGIDLTSSFVMYIIDLDNVISDYLQIEDRINRRNQLFTTYVYYMYCPGTIDVKFIADMDKSRQIFNQVINGRESDINVLEMVKGAKNGRRSA